MALTIEYLGHSGFVLSAENRTLVIDPFLTGNSLATRKPEQISCDYIALTHGHPDHIGDTVSIAKRTGASVIAAFEICNWLGSQGIENVEPGNHGGRIGTDFGWVAFTQAFHSSSYNGVYMGNPSGLVVNMGGVTFYHAGDTDIFGDMKLIGELYRPEVAALPVGDRFTMGARLASRAADLIGAPHVIPVHYRTFGLLAQSADGFEPGNAAVHEMNPGEHWMVGG